MTDFIRAENGHRERVDGAAFLLCFLLGPIWLLARGLWGMLLGWILVVVPATVALGIAFALYAKGEHWVVALLTLCGPHLVFSGLAPAALARKYLRQGWVKVE